MKNYTSINDLPSLSDAINEAIQIKKQPLDKSFGEGKTIALLFFNSSLRTRLSTEKAARNLGLEVMSLNLNSAWNIEFEDGTVMNAGTSEHIKEAAQVISQYADIIAVRAFPKLENRDEDESEPVISNFIKYATVPIVSLESATGHPLQGFADAITITEETTKEKPKVVLSWAPHPKALPHAVANSFVESMKALDVDFTITHPEGYELNSELTEGVTITNNQEEAFKDADFVYTKNWSSYKDYGQVKNTDSNWMITKAKIGDAKFMHCLPVRRNVVVEDAVLDSDQSIVIKQANNRTYSAQVVLKTLLKSIK